MAIQIVKPPRLTRYYGNSNSKQGIVDSFAGIARDPIRDALDPAYWQVTDVVSWSGYTSSRFGVCFLIRALDGAGNLTGQEWMLGASSYDNNYLFWTVDDSWGGNNESLVDDYFFSLEHNSSDLSDLGNYCLLMSYAPDGFPGFEFDDDGHIVGGTDSDGDPPAPTAGINPFNNIGSFFPASSVLKGIGIHIERNGQHASWALFADADNPSITVFANYAELNRESPIFVAFAGDNLVEPYDPSDTSRHACGGFNRDPDDLNVQYNELSRCVSAQNLTGERVSLDYRMNGNIGGQNSPRSSDGKFCWEPVALTSGSMHKGYLNPKFLREVGGSEYNMGMLFEDAAGDVYYKFHRHLSIRYPKGQMPWPYGFVKSANN